MSALVSKKEVLEVLESHGVLCDFAKHLIENMPADDAVPVVRCLGGAHAEKMELDEKMSLMVRCPYSTELNRWSNYCSHGKEQNLQTNKGDER